MSTSRAELEVPAVRATGDGTVIVELTPSQAQVLARILAHYDVIVGYRSDDGHQLEHADGFVPEEWQHTLIALIAEAEKARWRTPPVLVPLRRPGGGS